ncbi:MAG: RagB/SusD family nutrient uptake outer membrane protein [Prevotellaceae bacterium]|jgi:hypothetical protein|nr:RagB/SusD family nutrient uptake outer membrane protein [Prevotellaceae bacterium]
MKRKILILSIILTSLLALSCSEDYLNTSPTSSSGTETIFSTTKNAKQAVNGLAKLMNIQYLGVQGMNGEGTIKMWYGNYPGAHFSINLPGWAPITNSDYLKNYTSQYLYFPWYYYYRIIGNANTIILNIDNASGPDAEKKYIKAQALSYRAYSFMMLAQLYCLRWSDSNSGASLGLILRTDASDGDMARSTLAETYKRIYDDLDEAITLYSESGIHRNNSLNYEIDIEVAYATYARAALNMQDYSKAAEMAVKARTNYPLMSETDYRAGFCNPTPEWIWSVWGSSDETIYYYSFLAYIAYNSNATQVLNYPKCISKELFDKISDTDIRKGLFLNPADFTPAYNASTGQYSNATVIEAVRARGTFSTAGIYAYMQFKIKCNDMPGVGHVNNFRSSEMYLIEAEAKYFQNDATGAQNALITLNKTSGRDPSYTCTKTGTDLLNEIKIYRGLELWGEGFDWFDLKRWGDKFERKSFANGGSFISDLAVSYGASEKNKWTWYIPARETDYNKLAEQNLYE